MEGSFSAVSKPICASEYVVPIFQKFQNLHDYSRIFLDFCDFIFCTIFCKFERNSANLHGRNFFLSPQINNFGYLKIFDLLEQQILRMKTSSTRQPVNPSTRQPVKQILHIFVNISRISLRNLQKFHSQKSMK